MVREMTMFLGCKETLAVFLDSFVELCFAAGGFELRVERLFSGSIFGFKDAQNSEMRL
jgi:hypothetical protein